MVASDVSPPPSSCELCHEADTQEMVQCDSCDSWYHFSCVGVTADIANVSWSCGQCHEKSKAKSNTSRRSTASSVKRKMAQLQIDMLKEEKELADKRANEERQRAEDREAKEKLEAATRDADYLKKKAAILAEALSSSEDDDRISNDECQSEKHNRTSIWVASSVQVQSSTPIQTQQEKSTLGAPELAQNASFTQPSLPQTTSAPMQPPQSVCIPAIVVSHINSSVQQTITTSASSSMQPTWIPPNITTFTSSSMLPTWIPPNISAFSSPPTQLMPSTWPQRNYYQQVPNGPPYGSSAFGGYPAPGNPTYTAPVYNRLPNAQRATAAPVGNPIISAPSMATGPAIPLTQHHAQVTNMRLYTIYRKICLNYMNSLRNGRYSLANTTTVHKPVVLRTQRI